MGLNERITTPLVWKNFKATFSKQTTLADFRKFSFALKKETIVEPKDKGLLVRVGSHITTFEIISKTTTIETLLEYQWKKDERIFRYDIATHEFLKKVLIRLGIENVEKSNYFKTFVPYKKKRKSRRG